MINLFQSAEYLPWVGFVVGSCLGSFLNVVAYRIPRGISVVQPRSSCPKCMVAIPWTLNIPVFGWMFLKGRARCCGNKISPHYFIIELTLGFVFAWVFHSFLFHQDIGLLLAYSMFSWILIAVVVIDFETMLIPDRLVLVVHSSVFPFTFFPKFTRNYSSSDGARKIAWWNYQFGRYLSRVGVTLLDRGGG